jgi:hypothetical protein
MALEYGIAFHSSGVMFYNAVCVSLQHKRTADSAYMCPVSMLQYVQAGICLPLLYEGCTSQDSAWVFSVHAFGGWLFPAPVISSVILLEAYLVLMIAATTSESLHASRRLPKWNCFVTSGCTSQQLCNQYVVKMWVAFSAIQSHELATLANICR